MGKSSNTYYVYMTYKDNYDNTVRPTGLYSSSKKIAWCESISIQFDPIDYIGKQLWLIKVNYTTQDSFTDPTGTYHMLEQAFTSYESACTICDIINADAYKQHAPWNGYFEYLQDLEIHEFTLDKEQQGQGGYGCHIH